jgi:hypothetical protein
LGREDIMMICDGLKLKNDCIIDQDVGKILPDQNPIVVDGDGMLRVRPEAILS